MAGPCSSYRIINDIDSGPCLHPAGYQDSGSNDWCACHYGSPYDPAECRGRHAYSWSYDITKRDAAGFWAENPLHRASTDEYQDDDFEEPDMDDFDEGLADERRYESRFGSDD